MDKPISRTQQQTLAEEQDPLVGKTIGGCRVLALIGRGAMGSVYKATQLSLERTVALKTIRPELCMESQFLQRFRQEAKTVGRFSTAHVVQIHETGFEQGTHFLVMEFVGGGNLFGLANSRPSRRLSSAEAVRYLREASEGLLEAEKLQIVHRDIKPENLLLDGNGKLKIADFGIAKILDTGIEMTRSAAILGTPLYMSPEQGLGRQLDHRSDMYSLGASFYHLLTAMPPVQGDSVYDCIRKKTEMDCLSPSQIIMDHSIPGPLSRVIERMTALKPEDRYVSFADLRKDLDAIAAGGEPAAGAKAGRHKALWIQAAAGIVVGAAISVYLLSQKNPAPASSHQELASMAGQTPTKNLEEPNAEPEREEKRGPAPEQPAEREPETAPIPARAAADLAPFAAAFTELKSAFAARTPDLLIKGGQDLFAKIPAGVEGAAALRAQVNAFLEDARQKERITQALLQISPVVAGTSPKEILDRWHEVLDKLDSKPAYGAELSRWIEEEKGRRATEFRKRSIAAMKAFVESAREHQGGFRKRVLAPPALRQLAAELREAQKALAEIGAADPAETKEASADDLLRSMEADLKAREAQESRIQALEASIAALHGEVEKVNVSGKAEDAGLTAFSARWDAIDKEIAEIRGADPSAPLQSAGEKLLECRIAIESGRKTAERNLLARESFLGRRLSAVDVAVPSLGAARVAMENAFERLLALDLEAARSGFEKARTSMEATPELAAYPMDCLRRLAEFQEIAKTMARVSGGEVEIPKEGAKRVAPFYLDRFEVSIQAYRKFAKSSAGDEPAYLAENPRIDEMLPVEQVSCVQALAFAKAARKDLPTLEEWWIAARGTSRGGMHREPWPGSFGSLAPEDLRRSSEKPVRVDRGGVALGLTSPSVHHLAGNVAEWTKPRSEKAKTAQLVGGRYTDEDEGHFDGVVRDEIELDDTRPGYGFRTVLRASDFFSDLLPKQ